MSQPEDSTTIYTIGHSHHTPEGFVELLRTAGVQRLVDVRSYPGSRFATWANSRDLPRLLARAGIDYVFLGGKLGGQPPGKGRQSEEEAGPAEATKPDYAAMARTEAFRTGLEELLRLAAEMPAAIFCAEEDPLHCHRHLLVGEALRGRGVRTLHIRGDGRIDADADLLTRHYKDGSSQPTLF